MIDDERRCEAEEDRQDAYITEPRYRKLLRTIRSTLDVAATGGSERLGLFAHELRNLVSTAIASFGVLRTGSVGITGSTGSVLHRTLIGLRSLIDRSLSPRHV